ncbi:hypothetical protein GIB67_004787 [Kingdonia uniflora]|uniref:Uncharacterized protein n=1 Tax=Kingdonia uniflora TaxID=39325 RepID=A0A7J7LNN8_9MAGN|nr:hypothetical protein GIB67_004787 [Kingdonia uniflora]
MGLYYGIASNIASSAPISAVYTFTYKSVMGALLPLLPKVIYNYLWSIVLLHIAHCTASSCASIATSFIFTPSEQIKQQIQLLCGGMAGSTSALFITPFDVAKTRLQTEIPGSLSKYAGVSHALQEISKREDLKGADTKIGYVCQGFRVDPTLISSVLNLPPLIGKPHLYTFHDPNSIPDVDLHPRMFSSWFSHLVRPHKLCKVRYLRHVYVLLAYFIECNIHPRVGNFDTVSRHNLDAIDECDDDALGALVYFPLVEGDTSLPHMGTSSAELPSSSAPRRHRSSLVRALPFLSTKIDTGLKEVTDLRKDFKKLQASIARERGSEMS